jgi:hypothetical protein
VNDSALASLSWIGSNVLARDKHLPISVGCLCDCTVPRSRVNIDLIANCTSRGWVICKATQGEVTLVTRERWLTTDGRLYVGGRDRTKLVKAPRCPVDVVKNAP